MTTFNFYLETKVTTWYRTPFEIQADTLEDAKKKAIEFHLSGGTDVMSWHQIDGTIDNMLPQHNELEPTEELYSDIEGDIIWDNVN